MSVLKLWNLSLKRNLFIVVDWFVLLHSLYFFGRGNVIHSGHFELSDFLKLGQATSLLDDFFSLFSLCFLTLCVSESHSDFCQHFLLVFIHVNRIKSCWFCFRIGIDFSWSQLLQILGFLDGFALRHIKQFFIPVVTLWGGPTNKGRNGPPLAGENSGQLEKLLVFGPGPLGFLDAGIEPLIPSLFALFGGFPLEEGWDTRPLVHAVLHDGGFEDFVFGVFPDSSFHDVPHGAVDMFGLIGFEFL